MFHDFLRPALARYFSLFPYLCPPIPPTPFLKMKIMVGAYPPFCNLTFAAAVTVIVAVTAVVPFLLLLLSWLLLLPPLYLLFPLLWDILVGRRGHSLFSSPDNLLPFTEALGGLDGFVSPHCFLWCCWLLGWWC